MTHKKIGKTEKYTEQGNPSSERQTAHILSCMRILASNFRCVHLGKVCTEPKRLKRAYERKDSVRGRNSTKGRTAEQMCYKNKVEGGGRQERRGWWKRPTENNILKNKSTWKSDTSQNNKKIKSAG